MYRVLLPLVVSMILGGRGVAGTPPPSFTGRWYTWTLSADYAPGHVMMHPLTNPDYDSRPWMRASEQAIEDIMANVRADPLVQDPDPSGARRYWLLMNEPDLPFEGSYGYRWEGQEYTAAAWYAKAYQAIKANDPYNKTVVGGPNIFDTQGWSWWTDGFYHEVVRLGASFDFWAVHDWWGRFEAPGVPAPPYTFGGLTRHIEEARAHGMTAPIWVTETGVLWGGSTDEARQVLNGMHKWLLRGQVEYWFWFTDPAAPGGALWDADGKLTPIGRRWFHEEWSRPPRG